ncbi:MAG TPA: flagellar basal body P-ring formation chaperone FlgA [Pseudolabrys sp.]|nr:flagellar basal body P-ring formation chaperone FlgA [Pseudolabrys sp.]
MIRSLRRVGLIVFASLLAWAPAAAQNLAALDPPKPRLRAEAVVSSDVVRIGDLVANAGIVADVPIFRAPDLGSTGTVSAQRVAEAVRAHAIVGLDTAGLDEVVVTRAARTVAANEIESIIARALATRYSLGGPDDLALNFDRGLGPVYVPKAVKGEPHVTRLTFERHSGRFSATVEIHGAGSAGYAQRFTGIATPTTTVVMLARAINRGDIIKSSDIVTERRPRAEVGADAISSPEQAIGSAARSSIQPQRPLRRFELMKPDLVQRDQAVTLVYRVPGITLTMRGKALESGAQGDLVSVLNEQSKRTVQGTVAGPGHVLVGGTMVQIAENAATHNETSAETPTRGKRE